MALTLEQLMSAAENSVDAVAAPAAVQAHGDDNVVFIDVRDRHERAEHGAIPGSVHASRGMLELYIDPDSPMHLPVFAEPRRFVFYCAAGGRSLLAAHRAHEMGLAESAYLVGGLPAWTAAGGGIAR